MHSKWDGVSDHEPVSCTLDAIAQPKLILPAILQKQRENPAYTEPAKSSYKRKIPNFVEQIKTCRTTADLENIYSQFKNTILAPWERARKHCPRHFKYFWDDYLEYMKSERSKKYRRARVTASPADWNQYCKLDKRIRRTVHCAKKAVIQNHSELYGQLESSRCSDGHQIDPKEISHGRRFVNGLG